MRVNTQITGRLATVYTAAQAGERRKFSVINDGSNVSPESQGGSRNQQLLYRGKLLGLRNRQIQTRGY